MYKIRPFSETEKNCSRNFSFKFLIVILPISFFPFSFVLFRFFFVFNFLLFFFAFLLFRSLLFCFVFFYFLHFFSLLFWKNEEGLADACGHPRDAVHALWVAGVRSRAVPLLPARVVHRA